MPRYKRTAAEAELDFTTEPELPAEQLETRTKLRNMWEFASLMQYIYLFGHALKIDDDFDIDDLEEECLRPNPDKLAHIGLQLLKYVSSHRGLTPEIFDEYIRRQYTAKAPTRNPFGEDEEPKHFADFDIYTKISVLQQLSTWTFGNADRIRGLMPQDEDQLMWRMEPLGWDKEDRAYFVLDDNRLYRRENEPVPPPTPVVKAKSKAKVPKKSSKSKGTRSTKRRRLEDTPELEDGETADAEPSAARVDDTAMTNGDDPTQRSEEEAGYGFTSKTWSCIAVSLSDYQDFLATIFRTRDSNEKALRKRIEDDILPVLEKRAETQRAKAAKRARELENLQRLATAKRSGRLAAKQETERQEREAREAEEKKAAELRMAHEEQERQRRIEEGHESRRLTREQRLKEREVKRILHEEELAKLEEDAQRASSQDPNAPTASDEAANEAKRLSERQIKTKRAQHRAELEKLAVEEDKWYFDCSGCGVHGENIDDGSHSVACESCGVWQHSQCHGLTAKQTEKENFHFACATCKRKESYAKKPKIPSLKLGKNRASGSPQSERKNESRPASAMSNGVGSNRDSGLPPHVQQQLDGVYFKQQQGPSPGPFGQITNGPSLSPQGQARGPPAGPPAQGAYYGVYGPPHRPHQPRWEGMPLPPPARPTSSGYAASPPPPHQMANGHSLPQTHHQQQHQYAHSNAVASAGGHPMYHQGQGQPQMYGYSPRAGGMFPIASQQQQQWARRPSLPGQPGGYDPMQQERGLNGYPPTSAQHQSQHPQQQMQQPDSVQLRDGFQSPTKTAKQPMPSQQNQGSAQVDGQPPQHRQAQMRQPSITQSPNASFPPSMNPYQQRQQAGQSPVKSSPPPAHQVSVTQSPKASFPPPGPTYHQQQAGRSPVKSSPPPRPRYQRPHPQNPPSAAMHITQTPQALRPPSSNGYPTQPSGGAHLQTPQMHPSPASANANGVAADGMSGPWPEGSRGIPQKHDQSPAPPPPPTSSLTPSGQAGSEAQAKSLQATVALAPSPSQQGAESKGVIPVKKMLEAVGGETGHEQ